MSNAHYDQGSGLFIEEHPKHRMVKAYFTPPTMEQFAAYAERTAIVGTLLEKISEIHSDWIPYGTFFHDEWMFVYSAAWDEEEKRYVLLIDLASSGQVVGLMPAIEAEPEKGELGSFLH